MPVAPPTTSTRLLSYRNCSIPVISSSPTAAHCSGTPLPYGGTYVWFKVGRPWDSAVTGASAIDLYYDPFDFEIDDVPYPIWKRLRDEAPLYYNDKYNFYALSRYVDVARELHNWETYRSGRGTTADILFANIEVPPGILLFEDPPLHD